MSLHPISSLVTLQTTCSFHFSLHEWLVWLFAHVLQFIVDITSVGSWILKYLEQDGIVYSRRSYQLISYLCLTRREHRWYHVTHDVHCVCSLLCLNLVIPKHICNSCMFFRWHRSEDLTNFKSKKVAFKDLKISPRFNEQKENGWPRWNRYESLKNMLNWQRNRSPK